MQDRFKFRYVFAKDFGGKTSICYKMPIFKLDTITDENFNKIVKSYIDYNYKLISIEQSTGLQDKHGKLIFEGDILGGIYENLYIHWCNKCKQFQLKAQDYGCMACEGDIHWAEVVEDNNTLEVIGNIYENKELLNEI